MSYAITVMTFMLSQRERVRTLWDLKGPDRVESNCHSQICRESMTGASGGSDVFAFVQIDET